MPKFTASTLLFTDTDSLCYAVDNADLVRRMADISKMFDFSEYPTDHPLYSTANMKV